MKSTRLLILGCGYLGTRILEQATRQGYTVDVLSRNPLTINELQQKGASAAVAAYLDSNDWHTKFSPTDYRAIIVSVGSSESNPEGYQQSYISGLQSVIKWSSAYQGKLFFTSSTSVYSRVSDQWIDENTPPAPDDWRGETILQAEQLLAGHPNSLATVFRLGGIYGQERSRFLTTRRPNNTGDNSYLNLIHVNDAASAIIKAVAAEQDLAPLYNLTDNHPFTRRELQEYLLQRIPDLPESTAVRQHRTRITNRRIRSELIQKDLQWKPEYPSVFEAIRDLV